MTDNRTSKPLQQDWLVLIGLVIALLGMFGMARISDMREKDANAIVAAANEQTRKMQEQLSRAKAEADMCRESYNTIIVRTLRNLRGAKGEEPK